MSRMKQGNSSLTDDGGQGVGVAYLGDGGGAEPSWLVGRSDGRAKRLGGSRSSLEGDAGAAEYVTVLDGVEVGGGSPTGTKVTHDLKNASCFSKSNSFFSKNLSLSLK